MTMTLNGSGTITGLATLTNTNIVSSEAATPLVLKSAGTTAITVDTNQNSTFVGSVTAPVFSGYANVTNTFGFKNRIINGAMVIDQRNAGASVTATGNPFTLDRWRALNSQAAKFTVQQNAGSVSVTPPAGFANYLGATSSSAYPITSTDYFLLRQVIEGFNTADLAWGTASAATVTLSFRVYSSLTGTFGGALQNDNQNRSYPFSFSIPVANTWTTVSVTIAGDTTGTWATNNTGGIYVVFGLGVGSTYSGTAGAWAAANYFSATGAVSVVGTSGATFYITGVQLEKGSTATSFDYRPYGTELMLCQRYLPVINIGTYLPAQVTASTGGFASIIFNVTPRTAPTGITGPAASSYALVTSAGGITYLTSFTFSAGSLNGALFSCGGASGLTQGNSSLLFNSTAPTLFTGCEL